MTRRALLLLCLAVPLAAADPARDAWELLSNAASALAGSDSGSFQSYDNSTSFLSYFDSKMPGYDEIRNDVSALLRTAQASSSIEPIANEGDAAAREMTVEWTLNIVLLNPGPTVASTRRKERVKIRMEKRKKSWVIVSLEPRSFFSPPETGELR